jgi:hypothetical protein
MSCLAKLTLSIAGEPRSFFPTSLRREGACEEAANPTTIMVLRDVA